MEHALASAIVLLGEMPRFTPAQWQRLCSDAGLKDCQAHLFLRDAQPNSPWVLTVDFEGALVDVEAFNVPLPMAHLEQALASEELLREVRRHTCRLEVRALPERCPRELAHELVARAAAAALRTTYALAWLQPGSGILLPAAPAAQLVREQSGGRVPVELFVQLRERPRPPTCLLDTLGLAAFDLNDLEIELDPEEAAEGKAFLSRLAASLIARETSLVELQAVEGPLGLRWRARLTRSAAPPYRAVLRFELAG